MDAQSGNEVYIMMDEIVGEAANLLETLPEYAKVYITSGDLNKLIDMEIEFRDYLISDVVFITPKDILDGHLRGKFGVLLVCDTALMPYGYRHCILQEQQILEDSLKEMSY